MKYFTKWSIYTIKVVIQILRLIFLFPNIDPIFVVSLIVSIIVSTFALFYYIALQFNNSFM